jgi:hypothetical protein
VIDHRVGDPGRNLALAWLLLAGLAAAAPGQERVPADPAAKRAEEKPAASPEAAATAVRQVTAFAILAIPGSSELDPRLAAVEKQLHKVLPGHGFRLIDVKSRRLETGRSITCDLGDGYRAETVLIRPLDENGKVELRCNLGRKGSREFSTLVRSPLNQLFFYERLLKEGRRVLIGVGAR